jgi:lysosomal-associated membrane protein 1/2
VIANVQLTLSYTNTSSNKSVSKDLAVTGNLNATVDHTNSHCNENSSTVLVLTFQADPDYNHSLTFQFNETKDGYELTSVLTYLNFDDSTLFPGYNTSFTDSVTGNTSSIFSVGQGKSYKCDSSKTYGMKQVPQDAVKNLNVKISGLQAQAFDFNNMKDQFDKSISCTKDQKTSKIVPIAVGAALAGLVVVVLIAYLIGRFRSRKQNSYEALS